MDLFFEGAKRKVRFRLANGSTISQEDLFDLPFTSSKGISLNSVAQGISRQLKDVTEDFVGGGTPENKELQLKLDIVKAVIEYKKEESQKEINKKANKEQKELILSILAKKQNESLESKSPEELAKMLESLEG